MLFADIDWAGINQLRAELDACRRDSLEAAAQAFAGLFVDTFESAILARVFAVLPFEHLPTRERAFASQFVAHDARLGPRTLVLCLLGSRGLKAEWNDRTHSRAHVAIPLIDRSFVQGAPMIAKLLSDLEVDLECLDYDYGAQGSSIATRPMLGARNGTFYVQDAQLAKDERGRHIIPARDFVSAQHLRTVFGMGGAYLDGGLVVAIVFTRELLERVVVDRFPSLISNFKAITAEAQAAGRTFAAPDASA